MDWMMVYFVGIVVLTAVMVMINNWRVILALMAGIYLLAALIMQGNVAFTYVVVFLISGWLAISILVVAYMNSDSIMASEQVQYLLNRFFRLFSVLPLVILSVVLSPLLVDMLEGLLLVPTMLFLFLFGFSILMAGFSVQSIRYVVAMLLFFMGFYVVFATLNTSVFVMGMMAMVQISVALLGSYLIMVGDLEEEGTNA